MHTADHQLLFFPPVQPLVERFGREFFRRVPEQPGVYLMCCGAEGVLYVGKARNLRKRLASYRSASSDRLPRKLRRLLVSVERIHWDICPDEAAAVTRERELLLALRPRFNTIGTYPPFRLHVGWQRAGAGLAFGCGDTTRNWEQCHGPFRRVRPACAALLRLAWRALNPSVSIHELPGRLMRRGPHAVWLFSAERSDLNGRVGELTAHLNDFWRGESLELIEWLLAAGPVGSRFEELWRAQDAEFLREFFARILRRSTATETG